MTETLSGPMLAPRSGAAPSQAVVLLHGYGSDGDDLIGLAPHFAPLLPDALFVSPNAPHPCDMLAAGYQWFDISFEGDRLAHRQLGVALARPVLVKFLADLWAETGIAPEQTVLVGFSQGAMMALHVGLSLEVPLMGVIAFSGAFVPPEGFGSVPVKTPVCLVHGDRDTVVDPDCSHQAETALAAAGASVRYLVDTGVAHGISPQGLAFAQTFLNEVSGRRD